MKHGLSVILAVVVLCLTTNLCQAHKVSVFALVESDRISGEAYFSGGRPVKNGRIAVLNAQTEEELLSLQTDNQGLFSFEVPESARKNEFDLKIVLLAGEAHRNEWLIEATEYVSSAAAADTAVTPPGNSPQLSDIIAGIGLILGGGVIIRLILLRKRKN